MPRPDRRAVAVRREDARKASRFPAIRIVPILASGAISGQLAVAALGAKVPGPRGERVRADAVAGDKAITCFRVIGRAGQMFTWLALSPLTGRTHQLRVHCATLGMPILGDGKYGVPFAPPPHLTLGRGLHLHARALALPRGGREPLVFTAPLSPHMAASFGALGFSDEQALAAADWPGTAAGPERRARGLSRSRQDPKL
jgi:23S rRNA pseudouridine955/2504/2580 synthase